MFKSLLGCRQREKCLASESLRELHTSRSPLQNHQTISRYKRVSRKLRRHLRRRQSIKRSREKCSTLRTSHLCTTSMSYHLQNLRRLRHQRSDRQISNLSSSEKLRHQGQHLKPPLATYRLRLHQTSSSQMLPRTRINSSLWNPARICLLDPQSDRVRPGKSRTPFGMTSQRNRP